MDVFYQPNSTARADTNTTNGHDQKLWSGASSTDKSHRAGGAAGLGEALSGHSADSSSAWRWRRTGPCKLNWPIGSGFPQNRY